ncbi:MAG: SPFH domain-containing protein [Brachymonas sp.]|nr:SPFH domain-containing protein [Brachymonas sp.]
MSVLQKVTALLLVLAALAAWATTGLFVVDQRQYVLVYGAGQLQRLVQTPGLQFKWPWPVQELRTLDRRTLLATGHTGDQSIISDQSGQNQRLALSWYVQWRISDPQAYLHSVGSTAEAGAKRLNDAVLAALQAELAHKQLTQVLADAAAMSRLQQALKQRMDAAAQPAGQAAWGLQVLNVRLTRLDVDEASAQAAQARMAAALQQSAARIKEEGASAVRAAQTEAQSQRDILLAEGQRQAQQIRGEGDAEAIRIYAPDHAQNPQLASFLRSLTVYRRSFGGAGDVLVIDPASNQLLQNLQNQNLREEQGKLPVPSALPTSAAAAQVSSSAPARSAASAPASATSAALAVVNQAAAQAATKTASKANTPVTAPTTPRSTQP